MAREYRVNQRIRAPMVRVVTEEGEQLGVMTLRDALNLANERATDLVEVAPNAEPPVCRLLDYGKYKYAQTKKEKESRKGQKSTELREVRFRPTTGDHDIQAKSRTIQKLLAEGSKVKVSVQFRGRSITHPELGVTMLKRVAETFQDLAKLERAPSMEGRMLSIILAPGTPQAKPQAAAPPKPEAPPPQTTQSTS